VETGTLNEGKSAPARDGRRIRGGIALALPCRIFMGSIFLYAGIQKARDIALFAKDIQGYQLLPDALIRPMATYLPFLEIAVGAAVMLRLAYGGALVLSGSMLGVFVAALGAAMWRGLNIECGCFGHGGPGRPAGIEMGMDLCMAAGWLYLVWQFLKGRRKGGMAERPTNNVDPEAPETPGGDARR